MDIAERKREYEAEAARIDGEFAKCDELWQKIEEYRSCLRRKRRLVDLGLDIMAVFPHDPGPIRGFVKEDA